VMLLLLLLLVVVVVREGLWVVAVAVVSRGVSCGAMYSMQCAQIMWPIGIVGKCVVGPITLFFFL